MSGQLSFPWFADSPVHNLFLAHVPRDQRCIGDAAEHLRRDLALSGSPIFGRFHISLHAFGSFYQDVPAETVRRAISVCDRVSGRCFAVSLTKAVSFQHRREKCPLVLLPGEGMSELTAFHAMLGDVLTRTGFGRHVARRFNPHMTLLYDRKRVKERSIEPLTWVVTDFALIHSFVGEGRHECLARWPLRD